ncbi:hypothetical protein Vadar_021091 [Vaccinium darrowii]|uniref:Uncharacterized protein n=1 Tax=Vaccinium darrowii TaxID=229202 RepID=A0ACB7YPN2_9ERIC|nr:hypothetical protein Vadar_021091 [Vaccinium darrowii]
MWSAVLPLPYFPPNIALNNPTNSNSMSTTFSNRLKPDGYRFNKKFVKANFKPAVCARCSSATHGGSSSSAGGEDPPQQDQEPQDQQNEGFWKKWWRENSAEISSVLAELGFWSVLIYVLIDWDNPASFANILSCLGMMAYKKLIGDDALRPLRVEDAAALALVIDRGLRTLALVIDRGLRRIQKHFNFPSPDYAFALVSASQPIDIRVFSFVLRKSDGRSDYLEEVHVYLKLSTLAFVCMWYIMLAPNSLHQVRNRETKEMDGGNTNYLNRAIPIS